MIQQAHSKTCTQMFIAALFIIAEAYGTNQDVPQWVNGEISCGVSKRWNVIQC